MKQLKPLLYILLLISVVTVKAQETADFTDSRDNKTYKTVKIGEQVWMAENLAYLPKVSSLDEGSKKEPYYYVYGYEGKRKVMQTYNYKIYGTHYNWTAAVTACPKGWHLPSYAEWEELINYLGGEDVAGGKLKEMGTKHWNSPNEATNESGFTAIPGGYFVPDIFENTNGTFNKIGNLGNWWSSTESDKDNVFLPMCLDNDYGIDIVHLDNDNGVVARNGYFREIGNSVRCVKD